MPAEQLLHYLELRRQIDEHVAKLAELRTKENELIQQMLSGTALPEVPLQFDDETQTVKWWDTSLKLGGKSYLFIKTLWQAPRHRKRMEGLEQSVWKSRGRRQNRQVTVRTKHGIRNVKVSARFLSRNTLKLFLFRLQNRLGSAHFPYRIVPLKNKKSTEIVGYCLKCTKSYIKSTKNVP
jgi:hypothetical protein